MQISNLRLRHVKGRFPNFDQLNGTATSQDGRYSRRVMILNFTHRRQQTNAREYISISMLLLYPLVRRTSRFNLLRHTECNPSFQFHCRTFAHQMAIRRKPPRAHRVGVTAIHMGLRQPGIQRQKSPFPGVSYLKVYPPTAVGFGHYLCPSPPFLPLIPVPHPPIGLHLITGDHRGRPSAIRARPCASGWKHSQDSAHRGDKPGHALPPHLLHSA